MYSTVTPTPKKDIEKLVSANKVVVFMKGNPDVSTHSIPEIRILVYQPLPSRRPNAVSLMLLSRS